MKGWDVGWVFVWGGVEWIREWRGVFLGEDDLICSATVTMMTTGNRVDVRHTAPCFTGRVPSIKHCTRPLTKGTEMLSINQ